MSVSQRKKKLKKPQKENKPTFSNTLKNLKEKAICLYVCKLVVVELGKLIRSATITFNDAVIFIETVLRAINS